MLSRMTSLTSMVMIIAVPILILSTVAGADVPREISYQGRLADSDGNPVSDDTYFINFKIYGSESGDDSLWWSGFQPVSTSEGLFTYILGSTVLFPEDLFSSSADRYLGIKVGADPEISPRTKMLSSAYSIQALHSDTADYALATAGGGGGWEDDGTVVRLTTDSGMR